MNPVDIENAAVAMVERRGRAVMNKAKHELLNAVCDNGELALALKHYANVNLPLVMPIFPALMSLSYEAVTNNIEKTEIEQVATAMVLLAFSADIHDDIIDQSTVKYGKKTVYGKFGPEIAILTGDALLIQCNTLLNQAYEFLAPKQRQNISILVSETFFELSSAEVLELKLRKKAVIEPDEYFEIMRLRGVFAELQCKIGGIIGQADNKTLNSLASYGRTVGMLGTIKDEFTDMLNASELKHRIKFEYPPLPILYATQNKTLKSTIKKLLEQPEYSQTTIKKIINLTLKSEDTCKLKHKINEQINKELKNPIITTKNSVKPDASLLLQALTLNM
jgi:geranylgeranyl pyrophosphate synthase